MWTMYSVFIFVFIVVLKFCCTAVQLQKKKYILFYSILRSICVINYDSRDFLHVPESVIARTMQHWKVEHFVILYF